MTDLYLKPNIQIEPLFDRWYAWSYLIPPATAARNITERHMKIMDSYINAPQIHANAVKNPKMLGGPFIDYDGERVAAIRTLREQTAIKRRDLINLSAALGDLENLLASKATGYSLEPLYSEIPPILRGYIELTYDLRNQPSYRIVEPLIYKSTLYDRSAQSLACSLTSHDERPFVLSTPRLDFPNSIHIEQPFDSPVVDELFRLKSRPLAWDGIMKLLSHCGDVSEESVRSFFSHERPREYSRFTGSGVRWRYFGHACILVEACGMSILFDPVISYSYHTDLPRYTYEDLPEVIDYAVITHNHQDHVLFETLLQLRHKITTIVVPRNGRGTLHDPSIKLLLNNTGFANVKELAELEEITTPAGSILGLPFFGEHADLSVYSKLAYLVTMGKYRLMFAADSCNIEPSLYEHVHEITGDVDAMFLGMECDGAPLTWLYGPLLSRPLERSMDESRRLAGSNYEQASDIVKQFRCKEVYVYAMGQEPWLNHIMSIKYTRESRPITESNKLIAECHNRGVPAERLYGEKEILRDI